jgi:Carboxypeptidase regulatory-like domain
MGILAVLVAGVAAGIFALQAGDGGLDRVEKPGEAGLLGHQRVPMRAGYIVGYVRDVNGRPVPGARVRLSGARRSVRASRSGHFALRAPSGRRVVVAQHRHYTRQSVATVLRRGRGARVDFSLAITAPARVAAANSADRLIVWTSCDELMQLRADQVRSWMRRGADGFVCQIGHLRGMGGTYDLKSGEWQRRLRASPAVRAAREGELLLYLAFYAVNYYNGRTPFEDWFDDRAWSREALPAVRDLAAAAGSMGFTGLAIDQELYPQQGEGTTATWSWRYPGNRRSEAAVRSKVKERGRQLMERMVDAYPGLELVAYDTQLPGNWQEKVQAEVNKLPDVFAPDVRIDLWDGLSSVQGYSAIRRMDAFFYKTPQLPGSSWDAALEFNANRVYSYLSRRFSNWSYASSRLHLSPFSWVDEGPSAWEKARDPQHVAEQLKAFKRWGAGGAFANYAHEQFGEFDYRPYAGALQQASKPAQVDQHPPKLAITSPPGARRVLAGETISLKGVASDDLAIRAVRWYDDRGRQGVARLVWKFAGDHDSGWNGEMRWSIDNLKIAPDATRITISAEDIKGLARQLSLAVVP